MIPFDGECIKQVFKRGTAQFIVDPLLPNLPKKRKLACCDAYSFNVLADLNSDNKYSNDITGIVYYFDTIVSDAVLTLTKWNNSTLDYDDLMILQDNTLGTNYSYGFFKNSKNQQFIYYSLEWKRVLQSFGVGAYRVRMDATSVISSGVLYSDEYCLKQYTPELANGTIRIDYYLNGRFGDNNNDLLYKDFGNINYYNTVRLEGYVAYSDSSYTDDYTRYNDGDRKNIVSEQEPEYVCQIKKATFKTTEIIRTDILQSEDVYLTDYNTYNFATNIQGKKVQKTGKFSPEIELMHSDIASVSVTFRQAINNLKRLR